ncbi:uncharacterized protein PHACADRAFT_183597 [Phanerochaete carnosa HHB-10118-sp]|uniref:Uncharacterized protein n=1 Tax=Phanerochaete carnosa (strain HHB-10118-sp) TaxID=650164 RepID=K5WDF6_PHACS|nr:uncharacterized protein PHACADRAFT_183597 [Phanerochaete carnosa HHB-10118-sp]EKM57059.1 hypothetical protein PHACADRAFT_183597 [Phanerochaete carnosa HHB-10118-sp]
MRDDFNCLTSQNVREHQIVHQPENTKEFGESMKHNGSTEYYGEYGSSGLLLSALHRSDESFWYNGETVHVPIRFLREVLEAQQRFSLRSVLSADSSRLEADRLVGEDKIDSSSAGNCVSSQQTQLQRSLETTQADAAALGFRYGGRDRRTWPMDREGQLPERKGLIHDDLAMARIPATWKFN